MFALNIEVSDDQVIREMTKIKMADTRQRPVEFQRSSSGSVGRFYSYRGQGLVIEKAQYIAGNPRTFPQYIHIHNNHNKLHSLLSCNYVSKTNEIH